MIKNDILREQGVTIFGSWECPVFLHQAGFARENIMAEYAYVRSEPFIRRLKDLGVTQFWNHVFKGYGLAVERPQVEAMRSLADICHRHGLLLIGYCSCGSLTPETILQECPEAKDWLVQTDAGQWATFLQSFRAKPCYSAPGYIEYMKRVVDFAFGLGYDGIHFDNVFWPPEPDSCHCPRCQRLFSEFLNARYGEATAETRSAGLARFGRNRFGRPAAPWYNDRNAAQGARAWMTANQQAWIEFRCGLITKALRELAEHIHRQGKLVEFNVMESPLRNYYAQWGWDHPALLGMADMIFAEENAAGPVYNKYGSPVTRIRNYKMCAEYDVSVLEYSVDTLALAEAFAFNPGGLGMSYGIRMSLEAEHALEKFYRFYGAYKHYQTKARSLANVAVLRHRESMMWESIDPYRDTAAVEQLLQEAGIPFRIVYSPRLDSLAGIDLLIIPGMRFISNAERDLIGRRVQAGDWSLLLLGEVGKYDEHSRIRTRVKQVASFDDLRRAHEIELAFTPLTGEDFLSDFLKPVGRGSVGYIRALEHAAQFLPGQFSVRPEHVNAPRNRTAILDMIRQLLRGKERLKVASAQDLAVDICRREDTGEGVIHLVNISQRKAEKANAEVWFAWPRPVTAVREVRYNREPAEIPAEASDGGYKVRVRDIEEHSVLIINPI